MRQPLASRAGQILVLGVILIATGVTIVAAMLRTSTTFDEIVMVAGGARGYETGDWHLVPEHPPLVQYIYGLPVYLAGASYPDESGVSDELRTDMGYRYLYARNFYWLTGNDPERIAFLGRLPAVLIALTLVTLVFLYARSLAGPGAGVLAALLTASLPDVLAHGGVAYNDIALALAFLAAVWGIDSAIRRPSLRRAAVAGALMALALGVKNSAIVLAPIALALLVLEAWSRRRDLSWRGAILPATILTLASLYLGLVLVYRGDFMLTEYRYALGFQINQVTTAPAPGYLLGDVRQGFWYFFPVAFLYKTSAGLHATMVLAAIGYLATPRADQKRIFESRLRAPLVALVIFAAALIRSDLNIGFRHALPLMPLVAVITAIGVARLWPVVSRNVRPLLLLPVFWSVAHTASYYPFFLSYMSEYGPAADQAHEILVDSSLDWGQGLLELRDFMIARDIPAVSFSYFGSASPAGYGIDYVPLVSFFPLPSHPRVEPPEWVAISATNLRGVYFHGDPFAPFRDVRPDTVLARSIFMYNTSTVENP